MKNYKVILINLKKDVDRLMYMDQQLKSLGIEYERLEAVNGKEYIENKLGNEYSEENSIKIYGNRLKMGEVGCALSHKRCYEKLILEKDKNIKYYLILEDDITINKDFKNILDELIYKNEKLHK
ncbi:MAG: glycosyltransferase family 25 protein [Cyanobium sp. MAG06]|nr:glycosyltransferase family 25 protein [Cyanobium sp. MAG06]